MHYIATLYQHVCLSLKCILATGPTTYVWMLFFQVQALTNRGIAVGVVSNSDSRLRKFLLQTFRIHRISRAHSPSLGGVLQDLGVLEHLEMCMISEEEGVEKPDSEIWKRALSQSQSGADISQTIHVGDELDWCVLLN